MEMKKDEFGGRVVLLVNHAANPTRFALYSPNVYFRNRFLYTQVLTQVSSRRGYSTIL